MIGRVRSREVPAAAKLAGFVAALAVVFAAAYGAGAAAEPATGGGRASAPGGTSGAHEAGGERPGHGDHADAPTSSSGGAAAAALPGLAVSQDGYTLSPARTILPANRAVPFRFTVTGPDGRPVTRYERSHEKDLHLVVVRRDLTRFQHVHPELAADGTWSVPLDLRSAGTYRVFADFVPAGRSGLTLGTDVSAGGSFAPAPLPPPSAKATVAGYDVTLAGAPGAGRETELTFTVRRSGRAVTDLEPYLGAYGHLVSLRAGDLAYLHTHPAESAEPGSRGGPEVRFATTFPTAGTYRLFLDFSVGGAVHTAAFTVSVPSSGATPGQVKAVPTPTVQDDDGHAH